MESLIGSFLSLNQTLSYLLVRVELPRNQKGKDNQIPKQANFLKIADSQHLITRGPVDLSSRVRRSSLLSPKQVKIWRNLIFNQSAFCTTLFSCSCSRYPTTTNWTATPSRVPVCFSHWMLPRS